MCNQRRRTYVRCNRFRRVCTYLVKGESRGEGFVGQEAEKTHLIILLPIALVQQDVVHLYTYARTQWEIQCGLKCPSYRTPQSHQGRNLNDTLHNFIHASKYQRALCYTRPQNKGELQTSKQRHHSESGLHQATDVNTHRIHSSCIHKPDL